MKQPQLPALVRKIGRNREQQLDGLMREALEVQQRTGDVQAHRRWIESLLTHYYDPMYVYQRESKDPRVVFSGEQQAVTEWLRERCISE